MKFATYFSLAALAAVSPFASAESTLEEKWAIGENPTFSYQDLDFTLTYQVTDFILAGQAKYTLYTKACQEGNSVLGSGSGLTGAPLDDTDNTARVETVTLNQVVALTISVDPSTITDNAAVYSESDTPGDVSAKVEFCVRFGLWTDDESSEVNFLETTVTLEVDLSDGFEITSIAVQPKDKLVRTAAQIYLVEGYVCTDEEIQGDLAAIRNQGAQIRVCVRPDADARNDGIYMRRIDSFEWKRETPAVITQAAVENGVAASNTLTDLFCASGELVCSFVSILFASFYATPGAVTGSGVASMQFGGDNTYIGSDGYQYKADGTKLSAAELFKMRRNLRELQDDGEVAATSEFDLSFDVDQGDVAFSDTNSGSCSVGSMTMTLVAAAGAIALL